MRSTAERRTAKICAALLTAALSVPLLSFVPVSGENEVSAGFVKTKENTKLDVNSIAKPAAGSKYKTWSGSYVYFGHQGYDPVAYRVLAPSTEKYYDNATMFLDSEKVLFKKEFDNNSSGIWKDKSKYTYSDLYMYLNYTFLYDSFSLPEREAIVPSVCEGYNFKGNGFVPYVFSHSTPLEGDKIFLLDIYELTRSEYGYCKDSGWSHWDPDDDDDHPWLYPLYCLFGAGYFVDRAVKKSDDSTHITVKKGDTEECYKHDDIYNQYIRCRFKGDGYDYCAYWTRNGSALSKNGAGLVAKNGYLGADAVDSKLGVAPAMNIDLNSVLFVSLISGEFNEVDSAYKLTLFDKNMEISLPANKNASSDRHMITVPYEITGTRSENTNQVSILILDDKYKSMNSNSNSILYYDHLTGTHSEKNGEMCLTGEGKFKLPPRFDLNKWGTDYHVYILAEDINDKWETDYSSSLVEIPRITVNDTRLSVAASPTPIDNSVTPTPVNNAASQARSASSPARSTTPAGNVSLTLEKTEADVICGNALSIKATLTGTRAGISWKSSDNSIATVDSLGVVKGKRAGNVTITAVAAGKTAKCKVAVLYKDVTDYSKFWFEPTYYLTEKDVVKGYDNQSKFKPSNKCTRAQMVTFIWRLKGEPAPQSSVCKFSDVKKTDYFYKACIWGNEQGIVEGYKDGAFGPQIVCARKHAVTFLWRLAGKPTPSSEANRFKDVNKSDYFYNATLWASEKKILAGYDDGTFRPNGDCLRRQMVTFLYKYDKNINK